MSESALEDTLSHSVMASPGNGASRCALLMKNESENNFVTTWPLQLACIARFRAAGTSGEVTCVLQTHGTSFQCRRDQDLGAFEGRWSRG